MAKHTHAPSECTFRGKASVLRASTGVRNKTCTRTMYVVHELVGVGQRRRATKRRSAHHGPWPLFALIEICVLPTLEGSGGTVLSDTTGQEWEQEHEQEKRLEQEQMWEHL